MSQLDTADRQTAAGEEPSETVLLTKTRLKEKLSKLEEEVKRLRRAWTSSDVRELKSLAKKKTGVAKISKALKRTIGATAVKAHQLGVSLDTRG
jgi:hypothetical protein